MRNRLALMLSTAFCAVGTIAFVLAFHVSRRNMIGTEPAAPRPDPLKRTEAVTGLSDESLRKREKMAEEIRNHQVQLIRELIRLAGTTVEPLPSSDAQFASYPWHDSKHLATLLLGDLRAVEAVPTLVDDLEYKNPRTLLHGLLDKGGWYPAVEALSKIGMPAVGPIIDKLGSYTEDCLGRELCCWIIKEVLGARLGKVRLEMAIEESREPAAKENLTAALRHFKAEWQSAAK